MKKIAITQRLMLNDGYYELREALDVQWGQLFNQLDFLPIVLPFNYSFENYFKNLEIDGILLTGGNDLNSLVPSKESEQRDTFEKKLIQYGIENDIPIFGICRGMQIIAEYFGSDLKKVCNQIGIQHRLKVNKKSKYFDLLEHLKEVNSFHSYTVDTLSNELLASATNESGMIKAIEHTKYKIFAQMWHSEREKPFQEAELTLMKEFFNV